MGNWNWTKLLLFLSFIVFLGSLLLRQESAITQDLGRHLRLGKIIVENSPPGTRHQALATNFLTYTFPEYPFVNHHWGSEVIFYFIYKLGGFGELILFKALILGAAFVITALHASSSLRGIPTQSGDRGNLGDRHAPLRQGFAGLAMTAGAIVITFFSIQMMSDRLTTRPEIFGYLLFSLLFWILNKSYIDDKRSLLIYITPIIILLWVNLHISFVFGLILMWLWAGCLFLTSLRGSVSRRRRGNLVAKTDRHAPLRQGFAGLAMTPVAIAVISTLVTVFNPAGLRGALMPLSILKDYGYTIAENVTPFFLSKFRPLPEYWIYAILLTTVTILLTISSKKSSLFSISTLYLFSLFPLLAVRHLPFFALVLPPVLTPLLMPIFPRRSEKDLILLTCVIVPLWILAFTNPTPFSYFKLPPFGFRADSRLDRATKFVKDHQLQGNMWNDYDIGSYLEWAIPEHPTFVDGRPEAFPATFFRGIYIPMELSKENWDIVVEKYQIQWAFVTLTENPEWFKTWWKMIQTHPNWKIVYLDDAAAIVVRNDGPNRTINTYPSGMIQPGKRSRPIKKP